MTEREKDHGRGHKRAGGPVGRAGQPCRWKRRRSDRCAGCGSADFHSLDRTRELSSRAKALGADLFGVADLRPVRDYVVDQGGQHLRPFTHAISVGIGLSNAIVDRIDFELPADRSLYGWHLYQTVSPALDAVAWRLARTIEQWGYLALPVPTSQYRAPGERRALFPHKLAAHLAGLGWMGKNSLLITQEFGPRLRLSSILTDCPLQAGQRLDERCGDCQECVVACPVHALTGAEFSDEEDRGVRLRAEACGSYRDGQGGRRSGHVCGLCLAVCPQAYPERPGWRHSIMNEGSDRATEYPMNIDQGRASGDSSLNDGERRGADPLTN